jgi:clan AA aspartic protease
MRTNHMGRIITELTVTNRADQIVAERGFRPVTDVRRIHLDDVLVDTGAATLCLPRQVIERLGLALLREVDVETARGMTKARIFQDAKVSLLGREGTFECLELPGGERPLLGVIPLEMLGIELDLQSQSIRMLPMGPDKTYITIL